MRREITSFADGLRRDESGAVFVLVAIGIVAFLGLGALAIDVSRIVYAQRALQATSDLAAQAGATVIPDTGVSATATATAYSAQSGSHNFQKGLNVTSVSAAMEAVNGSQAGGCPTAGTQSYPGCTTNSPNGTSSGGCANSSGCNAVLVTQQAKVSLTLGEIFHMGPVTLTASSLALAGAIRPVNVMIVLDNTGSMTSTDPTGTTCGGIKNATRIECALAGVQTLLTELAPARDQVGLMVFPPVASTPSTNPAQDATCNGSTISVQPYSNTSSATYLILAPTSSYKANNTSTSLEATSSSGTSLINATCASGSSITQNGVTSTCGKCSGDQVIGTEGTYLAGAITAAQAELVSTNDTGVCATYLCQNVMIVLSDGGAGNASTLWQGSTSIVTATNGTTLTFASGTVPADVIPGTSVNYECTISGFGSCTSHIPAGTSVLSVDKTNSIVTLSGGVSGTVPTGTSINFGGNNQCWESIRAAQDAAEAGTRVISIAYGSAGNYQNTTALSPNSNGCADTETPPVNSCYTMSQIASRPGAIPNLYDFYSDPMGGTCTSPDNPNYTTIAAIFANIAYSLTTTSLVACGTAQAGGHC